MLRRSWKKVLVAAGLFSIAGCAALPDMQRIQCNLDQMTYYMGIMASGMPVMSDSTRRMADNADRMGHKADGLLAQFQQEKRTAERAFQNYAQGSTDSNREIIETLKEIRRELIKVKEELGKRGGPTKGNERSATDGNLQAKLEDLEKQLNTIASKVKQPPNKRP
jgi:hypothetical protein